MAKENVKTVEERQVTHQVNRLRNQSGELVEIVDKLEAQLESVVLEVTESKEPAIPMDSGSLVPLASRIFQSNDSIRNSLDRLMSLMDRIEI